MSGPRLLGVCLLCCLCLHVSKHVEAVSSASAPIYEDEVYLQKQAAVAPVGRPDFQAEALRAFAAGLAADPYGVLPLWTGDSHPCGDASNNYQAWPGITCNAPTGFVTAIKLPNKGLSGTLPRSISVLKSLRELDLSNNSFFGPLPVRWSNLTSLENVDLSRNQLTGPLPASWSAWDALQTLELHHNNLSGQLPGSWAGLNLLEVLDLSNNRLSGSLPTAWARMTFLSVLDLHNNSLSGTLPPAWAEQRSLLQLNLGANKIEGVLPPQWAVGMDSLRGVNVTGNSLSGSLPGEWSNMTSLQALSVSHNQLTGSIPATWGGLHNLYVVNITRNEGICGEVPSGVAGVLDANSTQLYSSCTWEPDAANLLAFKAGLQDPLGMLDSWRQGSNPCGAQPWHGVTCEDGWVVALQLEGAALRGPLTEGLVRLPHLKGLFLERNQLEGTLPAGWGSAAPSSLAAIDLSNNALCGPLPSSWACITSLQHLDLSANEFEGQLPDEWSALANLATLMLGSNRALNGTLPASWSNLSALQKAHLDGSNIAGTLPASWAKLTRMQELGLSGNLLSGSVPAPWPSKLQSLTYLDLSGNQQMCGTLGGLPANLTLQSRSTGLGKQCKAAQGVSTATAIAVGVCASFVGAGLLASGAYLIMRSKQQTSSRPSANVQHMGVQASSASGFRILSRRSPSSSSPRSLTNLITESVSAGTSMSSPPGSPAGLGFAAAGMSPPPLAAISSPVSRLAHGSTIDSASGTSPASPRSAAGALLASDAAAGAGLGGSETPPHFAHLANLRSASSPASPGSPRGRMRALFGGRLPAAGASPHNGNSAGVGAYIPSVHSSSPGSSRASSVATMSPVGSVLSSGGDPHSTPVPGGAALLSHPLVSPLAGAATAAAGAGTQDGSGSTGAATGDGGDGGSYPASVASMSPRPTAHSHPGSPGGAGGMWGSAVKIYEHGGAAHAVAGTAAAAAAAVEGSAQQLGANVRVGGFESLINRFRLRSVMVEGRAGASAAASVEQGNISDPPPAMSPDGAAAAVQSFHAVSAAAAEVGSPPGLRAGARFGRDALSGDGSSSAAGSPARLGLMMAACPATDDGHVPSPRGVAALMAAGAGAYGPGEVLAPEDAGQQQGQGPWE